jgi:hypothetical protein
MSAASLAELLVDYDRARAYTRDLWRWIGEVRSEAHGRDLPPVPTSPFLTVLDGYVTLDPG